MSGTALVLGPEGNRQIRGVSILSGDHGLLSRNSLFSIAVYLARYCTGGPASLF